MLKSLHLRGYRSLRDFRLNLGRITVITGQNGVGKSNVYRALAMLQRMAEGRFAESVAQENGMSSLLWAGEWPGGKPRRACWELEHSHFTYTMECGLVPLACSAFITDPDIKVETLHYGGGKGRLMAKRKGPVAELRKDDGTMESHPLPFRSAESMLAEVRDGSRFPALAAVRDTLMNWRFYHQFRTDADSPLRRAQVGFWSPVLAHDAANLASTLQSIAESDLRVRIDEIVEHAFPGVEWRAVNDEGRFELQLQRPGLKRWMQAAELSDGTLRFFCLVAALLTPRPPSLLVLNEPEASLHPEMLPTLAKMITMLPEETQVIVVSHSTPLAEAIAENSEARVTMLAQHRDETCKKGEDTGRRTWVFED